MLPREEIQQTADKQLHRGIERRIGRDFELIKCIDARCAPVDKIDVAMTVVTWPSEPRGGWHLIGPIITQSGSERSLQLHLRAIIGLGNLQSLFKPPVLL